jgi:phage shock protein E
MFDFFKRLFSKGPETDFAELLRKGAVIVDVRTPGEYKSGHIKGSLNIPVDQIRSKTAELKKKGKPVITCCRSGSRSAMARTILTSAGIECYNGGAWDSLKDRI